MSGVTTTESTTYPARGPVPAGLCRLAAVWLGLGLFAAGCHEPVHYSARVEPWKQGPNVGKQIITDHFQVYTTVLDEGLLEALPIFMEEAHCQYERILPVAGHSDQHAVCYLFQTRNQWERFTRSFAGPLAVNYLRIQHGGFTQGSTSVVHCIGNRNRYATLAVMAHEGMHQYLAMHFPGPIPAWLNEGLACYCEGHDWRGEYPVFTPKWNVLRLRNLREAIARDEFIPLPVILKAHAGNMIQLADQRVRTYYAQVWSMTVFLRHGGRSSPYPKRFEVLLKELGSETYRKRAKAQMATGGEGRMSFGEAIFRSYITEDLGGFMAAYRKFARQLAESDSLSSSDFRQAQPLLAAVGDNDSPSWW